MTAAALAVYALLMTFGGCADMLLLFPSKGAIDPQGASRRTVPYEHGVVEVWTARSPGVREAEPRAYLLEFTGNATRAEHVAGYIAHRWGERPLECWTVNYPGYGGSTPRAKLSLIPAAALAAYDALAQEAKGRPIFVTGTSLGTAAALHVAAHRPVTGMILQNPPPLRRMILDHGWWNLWLFAGPVALGVPSDLDSIANARQVTAPAVFLLSADDEIVAPKYQRMVADAYAGPKRMIDLPGARHNDPVEGAPLKLLEAAMDWLLETSQQRSE